MAELSTTSLFADANLQAYYKLEDLTDSKNSNTLTNNNSATFVAAKFNNGVSGGAVDADKTLSINSALGYTGGAYSFSFWYKALVTPPSDGTVHSLSYVAEGTTSKSALFVDYQKAAGVLKITGGRTRWNVGGNAVAYSVDLGTSIFHHFCLTYDGTNVILYLDGVNVGTIVDTGNGSGSTNVTTNMVLLGQTNVLTANNALGIIDDAAYFNRLLTPTEVLTLYTDSVLNSTNYSFIM